MMPAAASTPPRAWTAATPPQAAPALSPAYVKETIAAVTVGRRQLLERISTIDLFGEPGPVPGDPLEIQLLFKARDDYLTETTPKGKGMAMISLTKLAALLRGEASAAAPEMGRIFTAAMAAETAQKKINAMLKIANTKATRNAAQPSLADLMREEDEDGHPSDDRRIEAAGGDTEPIVIEDEENEVAAADQPGRPAELQAQPDPGSVPPQ